MASGSISTLGVGSGLELQSILDQLREVDEKQRVAPLQRKITTIKSQVEEFTLVKNKLLDMRSHVLSLSLSSTFLSSSVSNSDETVLSATVLDGSAAQSASVDVERLASKSSWIAAGMSSKETSINPLAEDTTFKYKVGTDGTSVSVAVPPGTTLAGLAELINDDSGNTGVTAKIIDNGSSGGDRYQLVLQAKETGSENFIILEALPSDSGLNMTRQEGDDSSVLNAKLVVDGVSYLRQGNKFDDVLPGVTMNLHKTGATSINVATNTDGIKELITNMVSTYNELVQDLRSKAAYDEESKTFGPLRGTTAGSLRFEMQSLMTSVISSDSSGTITTLFDLGMEFERDGTITLDNTVLDAKLADNAAEVSAFFLGDSDNELTGFADTINARLRSLTSGVGLLETEKGTAQERIVDLELQIESASERLERRYATLTKQFIELDRYMKQMTSTSDYLTGQFDSLSKGWGNSKS